MWITFLATLYFAPLGRDVKPRPQQETKKKKKNIFICSITTVIRDNSIQTIRNTARLPQNPEVN